MELGLYFKEKSMKMFLISVMDLHVILDGGIGEVRRRFGQVRRDDVGRF